MAPRCVGRSVCCRSGDDKKRGTDSMVQTSWWAISLSSAAFRKVLIAAIPNSWARVVKWDRHSCLSCTRRAVLRSIAVSLRVVIVRTYAILCAPTSSTTRDPLQRHRTATVVKEYGFQISSPGGSLSPPRCCVYAIPSRPHARQFRAYLRACACCAGSKRHTVALAAALAVLATLAVDRHVHPMSTLCRGGRGGGNGLLWGSFGEGEARCRTAAACSLLSVRVYDIHKPFILKIRKQFKKASRLAAGQQHN